jgi:hypothetical protein
MYVHRRTRKICAPIHMVFLGKPKHQMGSAFPPPFSRTEMLIHTSMDVMSSNPQAPSRLRAITPA